jgi:hypothetical protein
MGDSANRRFDEPDEVREFEHGKIDVVHLAGSTAARSTFDPGWRWSTDIKPKVGTETCQAHHVGYCLSGALHVVTEEGHEFDLGPGDAYEILPGHDAWVTGDAHFVGLEFHSKTAEQFATS